MAEKILEKKIELLKEEMSKAFPDSQKFCKEECPRKCNQEEPVTQSFYSDCFMQYLDNQLEKKAITKNEYKYYNQKITDYKELLERNEKTNFEETEEYLGKQAIDLRKFREIFLGTDSHLPWFKELENELGLIGESYYPVKKFLTYFLMASTQKPHCFSLGRDYYDNRINGLIIGGSGKGKGVIKNTIRKLRNYDKSVLECSGTTHPEQLIGKKIQLKKETKEVKGYFGAKILFHDEAQDVINENDNFNAKCMNIMRKAQDVYGFNFLDKKLVNDISPLEYCPETIFLTFIHPTTVSNKFFDTGSFRRYYAFRVGSHEKRKIEDCTKNLFADTTLFEKNFHEEIRLKTEYNQQSSVIELKFEEDAKIEISKWINEWLVFISFCESQPIRILGEKLFFAIKNYFVKLVAILALNKEQTPVKIETAKQACMDASQFLMETIAYYVSASTLTLSSDVWLTDNLEEAMFLEWLYFNGATSREDTKVSIANAQNKIGDLFGVQERQARSIFAKLRKRNLLCAEKGKWDSYVWLAFTPQLENVERPEGRENIMQGFVDFLNQERQLLVKSGKEEAREVENDESG